FTNESVLRDEAIACLALVDLKEAKDGGRSLQLSNVFEQNLDLGVSATAQMDGAITLRKLRDGQLLRTLPGFGLVIRRLRFAPRASVLVAGYHTASEERTIVWDWQKGEKLFALPHGIHAEAIDFSADCEQLALGQSNGLVSVYSLPGGEISREFELRLTSGFPRVPQVLRLSPDGDLLAESSLDDLNVQIWNLRTTQTVVTTQTPVSLFHPDKVYDLSWHPRGEILAAACADASVYLWRLDHPDGPMKKMAGHEAAVTGIAFDHRGALIASLGRDETLRFWVPATERQMVLRLDGANFERLQFSANDQMLVATEYGQTRSRVWEVLGDEYVLLQARTGPADQLKNIDFSPDGRLLAAVSGEFATLWDSHSGRE